MATKKKALQIGAGMVGRCIVHDMISDFDFVVLDMSEENPVSYTHLDVYKRQFQEIP